MKLRIAILAAAVAMLAPALSQAQFAGVQNGPSTSTSCQASPALYFDQQNGIASACGTSHTLQPFETTLGVFNAQTANTTVTTAQTMASLALNANVQNVIGRTIKVCGAGIYTSPGTSAPTLTIQVTEGGITPIAITTAALSTTATTSAPFSFCYRITTASISTSASPSTTGTLEAHGYLVANIAANTPASAAAVYLDTNTAVSSALNLFTANTLAVQVAASLTVTSVQLRQLTIELVQ
jgi:hypothetical protein